MSIFDWDVRLYKALSEVQELRAENERLQRENAKLTTQYEERCRDWMAEIERLRKEVAGLLDVLSLPCPTCGDTREDAEIRALEGK